MSETGDGLAAVFRRLIRQSGPISLARYMGESNAHYYASRDPLGAKGDFITAPEVSQMFGEMIGAWLADIWQRAGKPAAAYVELGPGRGTLASDALRVMARAGFAGKVHLVEGSPALREAQSGRLVGAVHHQDVTTLPNDRALLVVANEFFDALPVRQIVRTASGWREIEVGLDGDRFVPVASDRPMDAAVDERFAGAGPGTVIETCPAAAAIMADLAALLAKQGGAMLTIDYGHLQARTGSTLQAVRGHAHHDPFVAPGDADLTAHVDFEALARAASVSGARIMGTAEQGAFLNNLGIGQRASMLSQANPAAADEVAASLQRLVAKEQMGTLFKVLALGAPSWPAGAGFARAP